MIIHSIIPQEHIFTQDALPPRNLCPFAGGYVEVWQSGEVCRVISTDPAVYLDPRFTPGGRWQ